MEPQKKKPPEAKQPKPIPTVSARLDDGTIVEMVYDPRARRSLFASFRGESWTMPPSIVIDEMTTLVPYSPTNNLLKHEVVLLPSEPAEYNSDEALIAEIRTFIHRYVDLSPLFEEVAAWYVLFTWIYDDFNELPYLRFRSWQYGVGKTRALLIVGSLCYKPIFASGASTVSPLFRILDAFRGTLLVDEGDFRVTDERAEIVKILNQGNGRGFPVLRSEQMRSGEFDPRAYAVFGPKLVASRGSFEDRALESRFLTEEMGGRLRSDVPLNLPDRYKEEALAIRNKLLMFRFRNLGKHRLDETLADPAIEPRLNQIFLPLLSVVKDEAAQTRLRDLARRYHETIIADRGMDTEAQVLEVVRDLLGASEGGTPSVKTISEVFGARYADDYERKITPKWIGGVIRRRLGLKTEKRHGNFVVAETEDAKLRQLYERYGIAPHDDDLSR